jgi:histidine ammonia-lyase
MSKNTLVLTGCHLKIHEVVKFVTYNDVEVVVPEDVRENLRQCRMFLEKHTQDRITYGVNTGFGPMASYLIGKDKLDALQLNLIRSHAVGIGKPIESRFVLASMLVRLNTLLRGYSAVSEELIDQLLGLLNNRIVPIIPEHGAVGTSGDLVQLAHIALAVIGEGDVVMNGKRLPASKALKKIGRKPYQLKSKEGLALINGTSVMTGIGALLISEAEHLVEVAIKNGAFALELIHGFRDGISETLHSLRPHSGQVYVASRLRNLLETSQLLRDRPAFQTKFALEDNTHHIPEEVQEVYSMRCIPQILGPVQDVVLRTKETIEIEMNSVSDNPIVDHNNEMLLHGGNFHGDYIATAIDQVKLGLVKLTLLTERRINFFLNTKVNQHLPPFLNLNEPGLTLALQALQFVATSTTAQSQTLGYPHSLHTISTNADNQDIVSMGTDAALLLYKVLENFETLLTIEAVTLCQAVDATKVADQLGQPIQEYYGNIRAVFPAIIEDRYLEDKIEKVRKIIKEASPCDSE